MRNSFGISQGSRPNESIAYMLRYLSLTPPQLYMQHHLPHEAASPAAAKYTAGHQGLMHVHATEIEQKANNIHQEQPAFARTERNELMLGSS